MTRRSPWLVLLVAVFASLLGACGGDDDDGGDADGATTTEAADDGDEGGGGDGDMCDLFQQINDLDDQSQAVVNESLAGVVQAQNEEEAEAAFDAFAAQFGPFAEEELPGLLNLYDELADAVPDDRREDVELRRDFTADFLEGLRDASSAQELVALLSAAPEQAQSAGQATLRLDELSRSECDLVFAD